MYHNPEITKKSEDILWKKGNEKGSKSKNWIDDDDADNLCWIQIGLTFDTI